MIHFPNLLRPLQNAIATGDPAAIRAALPEPPHFLEMLFALPPAERDAILAGVFPALETDEDRWEIIEAAVMDSKAHPERGAFAAVAPYIPELMAAEARALITHVTATAAE